MTETKHTVLIVDDALENIQVLSNILYEQGLNIAIAQDGREALTRVSQNSPDLILLDIMMPGMDGFEVCKQVKQRPAAKEVPIIFLTAKTAPEDVVRGFDLGAVDYITKPFNPSEVVSRVFTHLDLKHSHDLLAAKNQQLATQHKELQELYTLKEQYFSDVLREQNHRLRERVKELNCLYGIARLVEQSGGTLPHILQGTVELVPPSWQYPDITCARITIGDQDYRTKNFQKTPWFQNSNILVHGKLTGTVDVGYLEEQPESDEGPFLQEERHLLDAIAERLGRTIERIQAEEALRKSEQQYRLLVENVADGIGIIQDEKLVFVNEALAGMLGSPSDQLIGRSPGELFHDEHKTQFMKTQQELIQGDSELQNWPVLQCLMSGENRELWMEGRQSVITWQGNPAILMNLQDITKRKLREMEIEQEREHLPG